MLILANIYNVLFKILHKVLKILFHLQAALAKKSANLQTSLTTSSQPTFLPTRADQQPCRPPVASSQYLADQRSAVVYRGRSLPNVNQMASHKSIDLQVNDLDSFLFNQCYRSQQQYSLTSATCSKKAKSKSLGRLRG